ncbi:nitroreductase family protein [Alicyclobacillus shizuokensis]|uniref:nitroreductase family protein n=1 Tax=Alicyclobacillus shizuokensis TaxID=392014 RepID=UPI000835C86A|nr:nitroreductase family protein [Alicyclobacillus shizuokensis]MCL6627206.1 nitroreductase family protein [Alicyclobacillus shizuokensis]
MNLEDLREVVLTRRNIKVFKPDPVDESLVLSLMEIAKFAPNHRMTQPWHIVFIGPQTRRQLNHKADFGGAPLVVAILSEGAAKDEDRVEQIVATSCFIQNFLLLAHTVGLGARWTSIGAQPQNRALLQVPEGYDVLGILGIGYPAEVPHAKDRTPIVDKVRHMP